MYSIVSEEIKSATGLSGDGSFWTNGGLDLVNNVITTGGEITTAIINKDKPTTTPQYTGGNTSTYAPGTTSYHPAQTTTQPQAQKTDYTPWIIGGGLLLLGIGYVIMNNNNGRRR